MRRVFAVLALAATLVSRSAVAAPAAAGDQGEGAGQPQRSDDTEEQIDRAQRDLDEARQHLDDLDGDDSGDDAGNGAEDGTDGE
ncbi:MAG TPA: hypothetical protein VKW76_02490 [Candidatus Binatia bacterium]|nr:hypothetical protein [Candidatus Binatia bacterium]